MNLEAVLTPGSIGRKLNEKNEAMQFRLPDDQERLKTCFGVKKFKIIYFFFFHS